MCSASFSGRPNIDGGMKEFRLNDCMVEFPAGYQSPRGEGGSVQAVVVVSELGGPDVGGFVAERGEAGAGSAAGGRHHGRLVRLVAGPE